MGERRFVFFGRQHDGFNHAASAVSILSKDTAVFTLSLPTQYCWGTGTVTRSIPEYYSLVFVEMKKKTTARILSAHGMDVSGISGDKECD